MKIRTTPYPKAHPVSFDGDIERHVKCLLEVERDWMIRAAVMASSKRNGEATTPGIMREPTRASFTDVPHILPHEKVFSIQIGSQLFRLSGASISSDGM